VINRFLRILFPEVCPLCKKPSTDHKTAPICPLCWQTIQPYRGNICQRCGRPLVSQVPSTCGECLKYEPAFKFVRSFGLYEGILKKAINLLKYHGIKRLSRPLSEILLEIKMPQVEIVIPVPLHERRLRQREFNQSALLAKYVAKSLGTTLILDCLIKIRDTMPQVGLSAKDRKKNIKKAFEVKDEEIIKGKDIMLIDDVFTTGATVQECSKVLKKAGAGDIYVITLAHSLGDI
jgi:ComF family protein